MWHGKVEPIKRKRKGNSMRLLICAGGTGGGVYPALAVLQALESGDAKNAGHENTAGELAALWVGAEDGMEKDLIQHTAAQLTYSLPFEAIPAAGVHGVGLRALPGNVLKLTRGLVASMHILRRFRPEALLFTGGFVAVPMALAARLPQPGLRRPRSLVFVPDIEPGLALKVVARLADRIAACTADTQKFFPASKKVLVTGYPLRSDLFSWDKSAARAALGLEADSPVLLVIGGSKGARSINQALLAILPELLPEMQVVHITGQLDWETVQANTQALPAAQAARYHAFAYLHEEMGAALAAADLAVSRAGASSLGEFPYFGLPAILVPYPHAWRYQRVNAEFLAQRQAAVLLPDHELPTQLLPLVRGLMADPARREAMGQVLKALNHPQAAWVLAKTLREMAGMEMR
jgi:UDP-N-acetylglucosamine--N-acetylmuramyl-(pentapeptide) pyrophosphoryl-undecaprenol N-acetylglucosamine transferase